MGFAIGTHFCGGMAVETELMIGYQHLDCGMGMASDCETPSDSDSILMDKHCCDNDYYSVEVEEDFQSAESTVEINVEFVAAYVITLLYSASEQDLPTYINYDPPLVSEDISILHQVFII